MIDAQEALIFTMVLVSAADGDMDDSELKIIGDNVNNLPIFAGYDSARLSETLDACVSMLEKENGLETAMDTVTRTLPARLRETAYVLACDVAAADGAVGPEEIRLLELIRHRCEIDRLSAAAIERAARARFLRQ